MFDFLKKTAQPGMIDLFFEDNVSAFRCACKFFYTDLSEDRPFVAYVLGEKLNGEYAVKLANREDSSIPQGTIDEMLNLEENLKKSISFCTTKMDSVPVIKKGDLVLVIVPRDLFSPASGNLDTDTALAMKFLASSGMWPCLIIKKLKPIISKEGHFVIDDK